MILLKAKEIGKAGSNLYAWLPCAGCGCERYVRVISGVPDSFYCHKCCPGGWGERNGRIKKPAGWHHKSKKTDNSDRLENELVKILTQCQLKNRSCEHCEDYSECLDYWYTKVCSRPIYQKISQEEFKKHKKYFEKLGGNGNGKDKP